MGHRKAILSQTLGLIWVIYIGSSQGKLHDHIFLTSGTHSLSLHYQHPITDKVAITVIIIISTQLLPLHQYSSLLFNVCPHSSSTELKGNAGRSQTLHSVCVCIDNRLVPPDNQTTPNFPFSKDSARNHKRRDHLRDLFFVSISCWLSQYLRNYLRASKLYMIIVTPR